MEYYSAVKRSTHRCYIWMRLENTEVKEASHKRPQIIPYGQIYRHSVYQWLLELGEKWGRGVTAHGYGVSLWGDENVLELVVMVAQLCD